jgi:hypothetical protein
MLRHNLLAYTIQPVPYPVRVDFAAAFFSRDRIARENVKFGKISTPQCMPLVTVGECECHLTLSPLALVFTQIWRH